MWFIRHPSIALPQVQALLELDGFIGLFCFFSQDPGSELRPKSHTSTLLLTFVFATQAGEAETQPHHNPGMPLLDKLRSTSTQCWGGRHCTGNTHRHTQTHFFCVIAHAVVTSVGSVERQVVLSCSLASCTWKNTGDFSTESTEENLSEYTQGLDLSIHSRI